MFDRRRCFTVALCFAPATLAAQSAVAYRVRLDSLARVWHSLAIVPVPKTDSARLANATPADSQRVGNYIVRADTPYVALGKAVASVLAPRADSVYGTYAATLLRGQFFIRRQQGDIVLTGIVDSTGELTLRSTDHPTVDALAHSWANKTESLIAAHVPPEVRMLAGGAIPMDRPTRQTWLSGRTALLLAGSRAAQQCVAGDDRRCRMMLGIDPITDAVFDFFDARQRSIIVQNQSRTLRRSDPAKFDRCANGQAQAACDSLAMEIPPDALPYPAPAEVQQTFVRYVLMMGGAGAFDRFMAATTPRARIEAAGRVSADSAIHAWRATLLDSRTASTAVDTMTVVSSLFWAGLCTCLALRSSRWR